MAYAAVTSLRHTIRRFLRSDDDNIQIVENSSPEMIKLLEEEALSLAEVLQGLDSNIRRFSSKRLNIALDAQIRDAVFELEDVVESHLLHQFLSQSQNNIHQQHPLVFSVDIEELKQDIESLIETVNKLKAEYTYELQSSNNNLPKEEQEEEKEDGDDGIIKSEARMFGKSSNQLFMEIKDSMLRTSNYNTHGLCGMAGIGKTTLARKLFQDPTISSHFERRAFVTVGPQYQLEDLLVDILKQVAPKTSILHDDEQIITGGDHREELGGLKRRLDECLKDQRYLIVLDDLWDYMMLVPVHQLFDGHDGSAILITTRLLKVIVISNSCYNMPFLNKKESWDLLCEEVFGDQQDESSLCPPELKGAGKKIAENCEGLPLTIVTVASILSRQEITPEHWNKVAANKQHSVYVEAYAKMHQVLVPSYYCLPQYLRISFLYMGVFPQNYEIPCSKLLMLWNAEGFIGLEKDKSVHEDHFQELYFNNVIIHHSFATTEYTWKSVGLYSSFWYVCKREAGKSKFFHSFTTLDDCSAQGIKTQRRLCIYNPVLFAIKDAFHEIASISAARSLLCTGVYHQYPVPLCFGLRLLGVLEALTIHFYEFPMEVLELIHLRYFALTCDGALPASISKLWNLMYLIVDRRLSIRSSVGAPSYLPVEIWDMKKLVHLQVMGSDLPEPPQGSHVMLSKLSELLHVSPHSCTESILARLPNLTKLGIRIELSPDDDTVDQPLGCLVHIRGRSNIRSFKCVVMNPRIMFEVPLPIFPNYVRKLTLSGFGCPWEEMSKISSLPNLHVLKLLSYAFRGPKWVVQDKGFQRLHVLVIEETDLVQWTTRDDYHIPYLTRLSIKHCYKLKVMPMDFSGHLEKIELVDCNPLLLSSANKIKQDWERKYPSRASGLDVNVHSSWDEQT